MRKLHYDWFHSWALTIFAVQIISFFYSDDPFALVSRKEFLFIIQLFMIETMIWYKG